MPENCNFYLSILKTSDIMDNQRDQWRITRNESETNSQNSEQWRVNQGRDNWVIHKTGNPSSGNNSRRSRTWVPVLAVLVVVSITLAVAIFNDLIPLDIIDSYMGTNLASTSGSSQTTIYSDDRVEEAEKQIRAVMDDSSMSRSEKDEKLYNIRLNFGAAVFTTAVKHIPVLDPSDNQWKSLDSLMKGMVREDGTLSEGNPLYDDPVGTASNLLFGDGLSDDNFMDSLLDFDNSSSSSSSSSGGIRYQGQEEGTQRSSTDDSWDSFNDSWNSGVDKVSDTINSWIGD